MKVSVVIPLYNKAPYICRALSSVLRQTVQDIECIVVDDGSTDGGGDLVLKMGDPRIRLERQANGGVSQARNKGIELARHPLIAFLDADDEWLPEFLEASLKMHQEHPNIVASFTNYQREPEGKPAFREVAPGLRVLKDYFAFCLCHRGRGMCSSAVVARHDTLLKIGGFPVGRKMGEDVDTWARLAWTGPVGFIPQVLAVYHFSDGACAQSIQAADDSSYPVSYDILETYRAWSRGGLVPTELCESTVAHVYLLRLYDVYNAISRGQAHRARFLYTGVPSCQRIWSRDLCGYLALRVPCCRPLFLALGWRIGGWILIHRWRARQTNGRQLCLLWQRLSTNTII
jgi:glycosyltransferase involved in cell wall biosynthesis